jgi:hypothetical protein
MFPSLNGADTASDVRRYLFPRVQDGRGHGERAIPVHRRWLGCAILKTVSAEWTAYIGGGSHTALRDCYAHQFCDCSGRAYVMRLTALVPVQHRGLLRVRAKVHLQYRRAQQSRQSVSHAVINGLLLCLLPLMQDFSRETADYFAVLSLGECLQSLSAHNQKCA